MPRCPNCSYILVLLQKRRKYKCSKCGNLYFQKDIENADFQKWNKRQRDIDKNKLEFEIKQKEEDKFRKKELIKLNKTKKAVRLLFNGPKPRLNLTPEEKKVRKKEYNKQWELRNPDKVKAIRRRRLEKHRDKIYIYLKNWRKSRSYESRLKQRLTYWRRRQRELALRMLEDVGY